MWKLLSLVLTILLMTGCTSIKQIGTIGSLSVWSVKDTDFFSANRLLLVVDEQGRAVASTGGTVSGPGPIAAGLTGSAFIGAGVGYAGAAVRSGIQHGSLGGQVDVNLREKP